ncbi:Apolipoprotein R [Holothuria leucospilota]|uniref:Apolipoprotein R n=1 Tax=Holothuria leucospilota TaxID=206669 RepID=A0A9Q1H3D3_HOLLE|nr:Apolipoprotein R [Holothuria leucospilota]
MIRTNPAQFSSAKCRDAKKKIWDDGNEVTFYCKTGYHLKGSPTATCRDGEWVPPLPKCLRICIRPISFDFALKIRPDELTYLEGDNITYSCKKGHRLYGATKATCTNTGYFSPRNIPSCEGNLQCHTGEQTVCEPKDSECNEYLSSSDNVERSVETCKDDVRFCYIYQFGVQGDSVTVNITNSGCVNDVNLDYPYGCYNRSYLGMVDSSGANKLRQLEDDLNTGADDVQVCICDRDVCNESVETAARNDATSPFQVKMILGSVMVYLSYWT